ncbi:hypothetical protein GOP47_0003484 [Adiantum capillus-veneris]|uniref:F-box/kelch-repeat protein n=1 Tax=Adiantum capillus-veneris TaxID=13818 RepID=A0A9D4ZRW6_ADICA|nr:hypothetical protein GOP47_0003484 [Adiantum capillus-veneris]
MKRQLALARDHGDGDDALIPGIPHDLALLCLARLPSRSQAKHRCVSVLWKQALESRTLSSLRLQLNILETHILLCFMSPSSCPQRSLSWWVIDPICVRYYPIMHASLPLNGNGFRSIASTTPGQVLFLEHFHFTRFDLFRRQNVWPCPPPLLTSRSGFASAAFDGHVYVAGGYIYNDYTLVYIAGGYIHGGRAQRYQFNNNNRGPLRSVERLDCTGMSKWERLPDMQYGRAGAAAVAMDGKLYAIGGGQHEESECSGEVWDPKKQEWLLVPQLWPSQVFGHSTAKVVVVMGRLLAIKEPANEIMVYEVATGLWKSIGCVPLGTFCSADAVNSLFFCRLFGVGNELWVLVQSELSDDLLDQDHVDGDGIWIEQRELATQDVFFLACMPFSGGLLAWRRLPYCFDGSFRLLSSATIPI